MNKMFNHLITAYLEAKEHENQTKDKLLKSLYQDEQRKIRKVFQKNFHFSIDTVLNP